MFVHLTKGDGIRFLIVIVLIASPTIAPVSLTFTTLGNFIPLLLTTEASNSSIFRLTVLPTRSGRKSFRVVFGISLQQFNNAINARMQFLDRTALDLNFEYHAEILELCGQTA